MGHTLMGGMISATILTLLVVPVAYTYVICAKCGSSCWRSCLERGGEKLKLEK
jgi:hypothetical protein